MKYAQFLNKYALLALACLSYAANTVAAQEDINKPIIVIGASYSDGRLPFNDALLAPVFGISIGLGVYLSLGDALVKDARLPGYVINEAQAGATTFDRVNCDTIVGCNAGNWQGYSKQLSKAKARVTIPGTTIALAKYVVVTVANDCLHSNAFGIPQTEATPCNLSQMNQYIDRLIAVGQEAINMGFTPIYDIYPEYNRLNLPLAAQGVGITWILGQADYNTLRDLHRTRLTAELPGAVVLDIWADFEHMGDGIHPNDKTSRKAAALIAQYISQH